MAANPPPLPPDALLAASFTLQQLPAIAYVRFTPTAPGQDAVELARRAILARNEPTSSPLDAILTSVHIGPEPFLYVFRVSTQRNAHSDAEQLRTLPLDGVAVDECSAFTPPPSTSLLPNPDKRAVLSYFYDAVRSRVIDDIVAASATSSGRLVKRFRNGFLMSQVAPSTDWQYKTVIRPLIFCQLQIHFSYTPDGVPSQLLVHPMLLPTPFLDIARSLPLPAGAPITLLPYGTPAYYLTSYTGPTTGLIKQFQASLQGLGAGQWENSASTPPEGSPQDPTFIIGWIKVENKQGEDKGITIIYPTHLCLSYVPHSSSRAPLDYIPELPAPLQPSPQVAPALPSLNNISQGANLNTPPIAPQAHRPAILHSPTSESLHSLRALTLSKTSDLRLVASEVGGYVDAIARERERERERLKREREHGASTSPRLARTSATTPVSMSAPTPSSLEMSASGGSAPQPGGVLSSSAIAHNVNALAGPSTLQSRSTQPIQPPPPITPTISIQNYYPSPPQGTPHVVAAPTSPAIDDPSFSVPNVHSHQDFIASLPADTSSVEQPSTTTVTHSQSTSAPPHTTPHPAGQGFDMYGMDGTGEGYLGLDMDMDMDFGMGDLGMSFGMNMGGIGMNTMGMGMGDMSGMGDVGRMAGMSMGMEGMVMGGAPSGGTASRGGGGMGMEFEDAFTDDDFSFFDRPARAPPPAPPPQTHFRGPSGGGVTTPSAAVGGLMSPPTMTHFADGVDGGLGVAQNAQQMWTPGAHGDGMTPMHTDHHPTPAQARDTDFAQGQGHVSAPATPAVHLSPTTAPFVTHGLPTPHDIASTDARFEPIPFAEYHRRADGKYANGKFAFTSGLGSLPSPPAEEDRRWEGVGNGYGFGGLNGPNLLSGSPGHGRGRAGRGGIYRSTTMNAYPSAGAGAVGGVKGEAEGGWKLRYNEATDPRIGVVQKLIGVKRKPRLDQGARDPQRTVPWAREDWEETLSITTTERADDAPPSDPESDDDDEEEEDADPDTPLLSRPTTPPPAYLPLGPTLLHTKFEHSKLLPLSTPLRPPGAAILPAPLSGPNTGAPQSVPTPVSPAATMGAASERSRSLESAAYMLAEEVVANPVWAETWRAGGGEALGCSRSGAKVWVSDCRAVAGLLEGLPGAKTGIGLAEVFGIDSTSNWEGTNTTKALQPLGSPKLSIVKEDAVLQVLPPAIRFWEKAGFSPKGGRKDVSVFVLFDDDYAQRQTVVENWATNLCTTYQGKHFGTMNLAASPICVKDGLVPIKFDASFRKNLALLIASFVADLTPPLPTLVLFLVLPITVMSLSSPILRQILSVINKATRDYRYGQIIFHFVPEQHLYSSLEKPLGYESALEQSAFSVYDRITIPVDRLRSRRLNPASNDSTRRYFMAPSVTLARPLYSKVTYVRSAHASLDVLDRYTLLHIGYHLTACGKWLLAACVDQRGESYETNVWLMPSPGEREHEGEPEASPEQHAVRLVWDFAMQFAKKTDVEWRVVFARLGVMSEKELQAWTAFLNARVTLSHQQPPLHHTLTCVVPNASWSFIPPKSSTSTLLSNSPRPNSSPRSASSSKQTQPPVFTDVSSMTYAVFPTNRIPMSIPPSQSDLGLSQSIIQEPTSPTSSSPSSPHPQAQPSNASDTLYPPMQKVATPTASSNLNFDCSMPSVCLPHPITILPQYTSLLIRVPNAASSSSISTTAIHLLRTFHSAAQASQPQPPTDRALLDELTRNYYELAVLAKVRMRLDGLGGHKGLPLHLAAVDTIRMALDREWDRLEAVVEL